MFSKASCFFVLQIFTRVIERNTVLKEIKLIKLCPINSLTHARTHTKFAKARVWTQKDPFLWFFFTVNKANSEQRLQGHNSVQARFQLQPAAFLLINSGTNVAEAIKIMHQAQLDDACYANVDCQPSDLLHSFEPLPIRFKFKGNDIQGRKPRWTAGVVELK